MNIIIDPAMIADVILPALVKSHPPKDFFAEQRFSVDMYYIMKYVYMRYRKT